MRFSDYQQRFQSIFDQLQNNAEQTRLLALAKKANQDNPDFVLLMKVHRDLTSNMSALLDRIEKEGIEEA